MTHIRIVAAWGLLASVAVWAQTGQLVPVISKPVSRTVDLPAEIWPYLNVSLHAKVPAAEADRMQAEAQLSAAQSTYERTQEAAKTPGVIAANDLVLAQKQVD